MKPAISLNVESRLIQLKSIAKKSSKIKTIIFKRGNEKRKEMHKIIAILDRFSRISDFY